MFANHWFLVCQTFHDQNHRVQSNIECDFTSNVCQHWTVYGVICKFYFLNIYQLHDAQCLSNMGCTFIDV